MKDLRAVLESRLAAGHDDALLRFTLGSRCLEAGEAEPAATHLEAAVAHDPSYSAAWNLLGRAYLEQGRSEDAAAAWRRGLQVAEQRGDQQVARMIRVFLKRLGEDAPPASG